MNFYDPRYQTWDQWASLMCEQHAGKGVMMPVPESEWREWGVRFLENALNIDRQSVPDPRQYTTWQEWAQALMTLELAT